LRATDEISKAMWLLARRNEARGAIRPRGGDRDGRVRLKGMEGIVEEWSGHAE